jgi:SAM-dependent methyltransferase
MNRRLRIAMNGLALLGIDPRNTIHFIKGLPSYLRDFQTLKRQKQSSARAFPFGKPYPCFGEKSSDSGSAKGHYFHQDLLVARRIYLNNPTIHVDVGSFVEGFVAHVASFRPIEVFDIRPLSNTIPNVRFVQADFMAPISDKLFDYCDSLSCLHALEHFGLGRYGDPVNYDGYLLGLNNLRNILKKGGKFYLSVPIGPQRIEFNAHRIFSVSYLLECFAGKYHIDQFSFVDDQGDLHEDIPITDTNAQNNYGCVYGCGIFEMKKI